MKIEFKDIIIIILICIVIYALIDKQKDHFTQTIFTPLEQQINNAFEVDMSGIRRLNELIVDLENPLQNEIDFNKYNVDELVLNNVNINDNLVAPNMNLQGSVIMNDHSQVNIIPRGFIMAWYSEIIPYGWILCDGGTFWSNKYDLSERLINPNDSNNYYEIKTPDLRGRFIMGSTSTIMIPIPGDDKKFIFKSGGDEKVILKYSEMPQHTHNGTKMMFGKSDNFDKSCNTDYDFTNYPKQSDSYPIYHISYDGDSDEEDVMAARDIFPDNPGNIDSNGNSTYYVEPQPIKDSSGKTTGYDFLHTDMPHNNMPPYHCVYYIMKK